MRTNVNTTTNQPDRYYALLKVADLALAQADATHTADRPDLWDTIAVALQDDCPAQSDAAARVAVQLRRVQAERQEFLALIQG